MIGTQVGPFTVVCPLREAGMGMVFLAEHTLLKTRRAVKVLSPQLTNDAAQVQRFVDEARAAARLRHRNLIQVHDVGQLPSGAWFLVLDHLDGGTLSQLMARHAGPMPAPRIVQLVCEIANGLQAAHDHQVVHRDLRPEHVFLIARDADPHPAVLLDLGVAQRGPDGGAGGSRGRAIGAPAYMSPEQLRGGPGSPAADIFALGVIAYQMSTGGWFPFQYGESRAGYGELSAAELYDRQLAGPPVDPRDRVPGLGDAWASAILAAVSADPAQRPASPRAFALRLAEAVPSVGGAPGGLAIVRTYARELIDVEASPGTPRPRVAPAPDVGSRYQLGEKLGAGGMAEVFAGTMIGAEGFARRVAIKRVLPALSQVPAFATMFIAEAQIASRLAHPNIVSVLDFTRDPEDRLFLVMEYVDGKDLASLLESGPIAPSLAIFILIEMLRALGYAHELADPVSGTRGVIHRDVSPQNLLLSYEGAVKVSDFGLAKARAASEGVRSETVRGKPRYMSPEQMSCELLDGRTDLYAVGVMLWEMLAQRSLFGGTAKEISAQVLFKDIPRPGRFRRGVPADLEAVAMKLLARDPCDRYPTAEAAIEALLRCADVPRDGRGELVQVLAARFPTGSGARASRAARTPVGPITLAAPPSVIAGAPRGAARGLARPLRRRATAVWALLVVLGLAIGSAVVIAREQGAPRQGAAASEQAPERAPTATRVHVEPARPSQLTTPVAAERPLLAPTVRAASPARSRSAPRRERDRAVPTGELAIIVRPWAMIWLNGKPRGQTPLRAVVPAGRYRVRIANDDLGRDETTIVTVAPDRGATIERAW